MFLNISIRRVEKNSISEQSLNTTSISATGEKRAPPIVQFFKWSFVDYLLYVRCYTKYCVFVILTTTLLDIIISILQINLWFKEDVVHSYNGILLINKKE